MYACMNYLNRLLVNVGAGVRTSARGTKLAIGDIDVSVIRVAPELASGRTRVSKSILKELELLDQINLLESSLALF